MAPWRFEGTPDPNRENFGSLTCGGPDYLAGAAAAAGGAAAAAGAALPAVEGAAGVAAVAACGCAAGLIQQA
jgi:hypothetical protein